MKNQSFNYSKTYYKVVREDDTHNGLRYRAGRVDDPVPFNNDPTASCVAGGIYFTDIENIALFFAWGEKVYPLTIPAGSPVVADPSGNKWRAPTVIMQDAISKMDAIALMPEKISGSLSLSGCTIPEDWNEKNLKQKYNVTM